jgi:hypothetical protein
VQAMARDYVPNPVGKGKAMIGYAKPDLISTEYAALNAQLHRENLAYGVGGGKHADTVKKLREQCACASVLDYGCGKGYLAKALDFPIWEYDPAIPEKSRVAAAGGPRRLHRRARAHRARSSCGTCSTTCSAACARSDSS